MARVKCPNPQCKTICRVADACVGKAVVCQVCKTAFVVAPTGQAEPSLAEAACRLPGGEQILGQYVLLERLGEGGMGEVYKARHQLMNRIVAIKIIRKEMLTRPEAIERFRREIQMVAQLDHPNLVRAHDAAQVGDKHFLVMEYIEGADVHRLVEKSGPLGVMQACVYIRQAALGLQYASERGLVHRDIKPSNLRVSAQGATVKVLDIGLARTQLSDGQGDRVALTQARTIMGTPDYIAPEQIDDAHQVDIRADIYSLGCTFYFMLSGRPPFPKGTWEEKLVCHRKVEPSAIETLCPDVPPALGAVLRKMMAKRPEDRYATPAGVAGALEPFCGVTRPTRATAGLAAAGASQAASIASQPPPLGPATPNSLLNPGGYEPGWTLVLSTSDGGSPASANQQPVSPFSAATVLPAAPSPIAAVTLPPTLVVDRSTSRKRKKSWLILVVGAFLGLGVLILSLAIVSTVILWPKGQTPGAKDEKPEAIASESKERPKAANDANVVLYEDFQKVPLGELPKGWDNQQNIRVQKLGDRRCLMVISSGELLAPETIAVPTPVGSLARPGIVKLPRLSLKGDFAVECELQMPAQKQRNQFFSVELNTYGADPKFGFMLNNAGQVRLVPDKRFRAPVPLDGFRDEDIRFRLERRGNSYRVEINGQTSLDSEQEILPWEQTGRTKQSAMGMIEYVYLMISAADPDSSSIRSVKISLLDSTNSGTSK